MAAPETRKQGFCGVMASCASHGNGWKLALTSDCTLRIARLHESSVQSFVFHGILVCRPDRAVSLGNVAFHWFALDWSKRMIAQCMIASVKSMGVLVVRHLLCISAHLKTQRRRRPYVGRREALHVVLTLFIIRWFAMNWSKRMITLFRYVLCKIYLWGYWLCEDG